MYVGKNADPLPIVLYSFVFVMNDVIMLTAFNADANKLRVTAGAFTLIV